MTPQSLSIADLKAVKKRKELTKNECKYIANFALFAYADVYARDDEGFHENYTIRHKNRNINEADYYVPSEREKRIVISEFKRLVNIIAKRMSKYRSLSEIDTEPKNEEK